MTPQIHHVAGRLRVRVPAVKGSRESAARVKDLLQAVEGVSAADRGYFETTPSAPPRDTVAVRIGNKIATAVFWYCLEIALERSLPLMLAALL
jgi:hypothetical protein